MGYYDEEIEEAMDKFGGRWRGAVVEKTDKALHAVGKRIGDKDEWKFWEVYTMQGDPREGFIDFLKAVRKAGIKVELTAEEYDKLLQEAKDVDDGTRWLWQKNYAKGLSSDQTERYHGRPEDVISNCFLDVVQGYRRQAEVTDDSANVTAVAKEAN